MALSDIHIPVMLERCVELLAPAISHEGATVIDATLGMGGHTEVLLERFPGLTVIGLDRDTDALAIATSRLSRFGDRLVPVHSSAERRVGKVCRSRWSPSPYKQHTQCSNYM